MNIDVLHINLNEILIRILMYLFRLIFFLLRWGFHWNNFFFIYQFHCKFSTTWIIEKKCGWRWFFQDKFSSSSDKFIFLAKKIQKLCHLCAFSGSSVHAESLYLCYRVPLKLMWSFWKMHLKRYTIFFLYFG